MNRSAQNAVTAWAISSTGGQTARRRSAHCTPSCRTGAKNNLHGGDRLSRPTSRVPHPGFPYRPFKVGQASGVRFMAKIKNRLPPFVAVFREMLQCEAWEAISNPARVAYVHLKAKCVTANVCEITLSFKEMERIMSRHTYSKAIDQLEECGFIIKAQRGGLYRRRNFYRFTDGWRTYRKKADNKTNSSAVYAPSVVQF